MHYWGRPSWFDKESVNKKTENENLLLDIFKKNYGVLED